MGFSFRHQHTDGSFNSFECSCSRGPLSADFRVMLTLGSTVFINVAHTEIQNILGMEVLYMASSVLKAIISSQGTACSLLNKAQVIFSSVQFGFLVAMCV